MRYPWRVLSRLQDVQGVQEVVTSVNSARSNQEQRSFSKLSVAAAYAALPWPP